MRTTRAYFAGAVLGASLVTTVWLYTYRAWETNLIRDQHGVVVVDTIRLRVWPWWAVLGALSLPLIGAGVSLWILPEGRRLIERFGVRLAAIFFVKPIRRVNAMRVYCAGVVLGATSVGAVWLYTYRTWDTTLWWALLVAYSLPFIGAGISFCLLPEGRRLIQRFAGYFVKPSEL